MKVCRYGCILVIFVIMAIFTMSEGSRRIKIGYDIKRMEDELVRLSEESKKLKYKSDKLKKPETISMKVKNMNLDLDIQQEKDEDNAVVRKSRKQLNRKLSGKVEA